jgi:prefoldin subunit 5
MAPCDRLNNGLEKLQANDCKTNCTLQSAKEEYEKLADQADQLLQEKQAREQEKLLR